MGHQYAQIQVLVISGWASKNSLTCQSVLTSDVSSSTFKLESCVLSRTSNLAWATSICSCILILSKSALCLASTSMYFSFALRAAASTIASVDFLEVWDRWDDLEVRDERLLNVLLEFLDTESNSKSCRQEVMFLRTVWWSFAIPSYLPWNSSRVLVPSHCWRWSVHLLCYM